MTLATIGITGSRSLRDGARIFRVLGMYHEVFSHLVVVHGGQRGADLIADRWAALHDVQTIVFTPDFRKYGQRRAFTERNQQIIDYLVQSRKRQLQVVLLAFPTVASRGTWDAVRRARLAGITVKVYR